MKIECDPGLPHGWQLAWAQSPWLVLSVAQGEPPREPTEHQGRSTTLLAVRVLVLVQDAQWVNLVREA